MKRLFFVSTLLVVLGFFLPSAVMADGRNKPRRAKVVNCAKLKGKARKACEARAAKAAAAAEARRREAARRYELAQQTLENRLRAESIASIAKDDTTGEDLKVRQVALNALGDRAGTVFVMESQTGKVLTVVNQNWAYRRSYIPCSTIKLVTTVAGLNENVIDEDEEDDNPANVSKLDWSIAKSKNGYFDKVGAKVGVEKFVKTAQTLGLGQKTGINADGEIPGRLPLVKKTGMSKQRFYSFGEGTEVTAPQLAVMASGLTNGGKKVTPFIPKPGQATPQTSKLDIPQETLKEVVPGMQGATEFGTARLSGGFNLGVAGKTGTCSDSISRIGLFTSVAPVKDPQYTVVVIIRGRKYLGKTKYTNGPVAARIAGKVYQGLLGDNSEIAQANKLSTSTKEPKK